MPQAEAKSNVRQWHAKVLLRLANPDPARDACTCAVTVIFSCSYSLCFDDTNSVLLSLPAGLLSAANLVWTLPSFSSPALFFFFSMTPSAPLPTSSHLIRFSDSISRRLAYGLALREPFG